MVSRQFTISNQLGLHARPAAQFVKLASGFTADIWAEKEDEKVNGKSIMGLMLLAAERGAVITVSADGEDEEQALEAIGDLIANRFGEGP